MRDTDWWTFATITRLIEDSSRETLTMPPVRKEVGMSTSFAPSPIDLTGVPDVVNDRKGAFFVVRGDMRVLRVDAHMVPTDSRASVTESWSWLWDEHQPKRRRTLTRQRRALVDRRAAVLKPRSQRVVVAANIAVIDDVDPFEWLRDGLIGALHAYGAWLHDDPSRQENLRGAPLLAIPVLGTDRGGFAHRRGAVVRMILDVTDEYLRRRHRGEAMFDIVLVCRDESDYTAVQSERRLRQLPGAPSWLLAVERVAATGQLGVMFGAGASVSLGLPTWPVLLEALAADLHADPADVGQLRGLDPVDAASLLVDLARANRRSFSAALRRHLSTAECSLTHALIANLRPALAITTNYDAGYENALRAMGEIAPAVLPWDQPTSAGQPRLLKLHGDVDRGSIVLSRDDFVTMRAHRRPLGGMLQERMMVGHLLAVGTTMSDPTLVVAAEEVSSLLRSANRGQAKSGTVVLTQDDVARRALLARSFNVVVADHDGATAATAARRVEILLDRLAMSSDGSLGFLLDDAYDDLVRPRQRRMVGLLRDLDSEVRGGPLDRAVREALLHLGRRPGSR